MVVSFSRNIFLKLYPGDEMSIGAIKDLAIRLEEMGEL